MNKFDFIKDQDEFNKVFRYIAVTLKHQLNSAPSISDKHIDIVCRRCNDENDLLDLAIKRGYSIKEALN